MKKEQKRSREEADPTLAHKQYRTSPNLYIPNKNTYSTYKTEARWHETRPELVAEKDVVTNKQTNKQINKQINKHTNRHTDKRTMSNKIDQHREKDNNNWIKNKQHKED